MPSTPRTSLYPTRSGAGALLGARLAALGYQGAILLGITPEGVEVAANAAKALAAPFDVIVSAFIQLGSKLAPVGGVAEAASAELDPEFQPGMSLMEKLQASIDEARARVRQDLILYRTQRPLKPLQGRHAIVVDGQILFPWRALAAARAAEALGAARVSIATPVASQAAAERLRARRYEVISLAIVAEAEGERRFFGDAGGDSPERLRAIMIAHQAA